MIEGIREVILYVKDMSAQVDFYTKQLGLTLEYHSKDTNFKNEFWVPLNTGACKLALHAGGTKDLGKDAPKIVFFVNDIHTAREQLLNKNITISNVRSPAEGVFVVDFSDPEGNKLSLESLG